MKLTKYKITASKCPGYMMVIYQEDNFKSVINEFKPPLNEVQLNAILNYIPNDHKSIEAIFAAKYGEKVKVEPVKAIGAEQQAVPEYPVQDKVALWCVHYSNNHKDANDNPIKYKTGPAEAGKLKLLAVTPEELDEILQVYFKSDEWFTKPKSISNFINKYNEIRALAYSKPVEKKKKFPLPYEPLYFSNLSTTDQRLYWDFLRENGYKWVENHGRGGKWEKQHTIK